MKVCGYCGRENDEVALRCRECGNSFAVGPPSRPDDSSGPEVVPSFLSTVAGGLAVVLICTGIVVLTRRILPAIYLLSLSLVAWMVVLTFVALALTLYAGSVCCRTQLNRVAFTFVVLAVLAFEGAALLPGETGLGSQGSWVIVYGSSGLMIITGALTLARIAEQTSHHSPKKHVSAVTSGGNVEIVSQASSKPALSVTTVICVVAGVLLLSFLAFWGWVYITPHW